MMKLHDEIRFIGDRLFETTSYINQLMTGKTDGDRGFLVAQQVNELGRICRHIESLANNVKAIYPDLDEPPCPIPEPAGAPT